MEVSELMTSAAEVLQDTEHITYTIPQLITGLNQACLATVLVKPEACSSVETATLKEGSQQTLPDGSLRLLEPYYRLDDTGNPVAHVTLVEREEFDFLPTPAGPVRHVSYSEKVPDIFWVSPPATAGVKLSLLCSQAPTKITDETDDFPLSDKYSLPVTEYLLYLMFRRDSERSPNATRAQAHRQAFFDLLQVKTAGDTSVSPETKRVSGM